MRHFLTLKDYSKEEILEILELGLQIKQEVKAKVFTPHLANQTLAMIFEKSSTRTRVSFEVGMYQLGGHALFLSNRDIHLGRGEPVKDTARVISSMCDMVMIRTYEQSMLEEFSRNSKVPVINGLSDSYHPVQLLADYMTMMECGKDKNPIVAYVGDGNNMTHSWLMLASKLGFELRIATPKGYECDPAVIADALLLSEQSGAKIMVTNDPKEAVKGATVVTTDTWISMGQEEEKAQRIRAFEGYIVDEALMSLATEEAIFLHCLPAYRGVEVSEAVLEGAQSLIFEEAENRLHAQKGLMVWLNKHR
ncbi:ornithine carbamoyltransferase [Sulfuricurvum sp. RIFCSPLOWO2_12_FULL_43_24]|uniref:ornithine carbamoyltransferase n=1 Tax=Sulfuricurvum sp. RIFCSPLOWO2_12_FULL_43_24 TaxID=1802247 RepID=UPI0008D79B83|nr:ornithine carbamoyltransferase [Sulfuricurvum sp. RIFCSPLOWO2_12_FULL_43_24]OHD81863.1 MAG: ornithine carbamoyltransferase [Sulfuricurvum sp. RIFCSPHIGHO2_02_FULL_43_9]OHD85236.1 MAG: ornithine carbamoyltransferase [Sulfuricurvum sp. RIFCSPLOWO2_02_43_6]OHD85499.1 MAG: ornithine carbamoyltransferase [Sulfuricurvum sp. RIFCSPLOWO2_02_FULL_43_45]OHD89270.1 MAG: ornithine carbamoyltransferase [Sulfuricurvum sp. RIFCSPLOWO2_12_43_5]OHD88440.1 MAG: ornithine carbamoyltransferase [Sulfuricurvum s